MVALDLPLAHQHLRGLEQALGLPQGDASAALDALSASRASALALDDEHVAYVVAGVPYQGGLALVEVGRNLANGGASLTLAKHNEQLAASRLYVPDSTLFYQTVDTLHTIRSESPAAVGAFAHLSAQLRGRWVRLATDFVYAKDGVDRAIYHPGTNQERTGGAALVGPDEPISSPQTHSAEYVRAFTGTSDVARVNTVLQDLTGKPAYAYRINQRPTRNTRRAAWVGAGSVGCVLVGDDDVDSGPSLGWSARKISTGNKG